MTANLSAPATSGQAPLDAFWREHGRQWALEEASKADLERVAGLSRQVAGLPQDQREASVVAALRDVWEAGFASAVDAFGWNEMNDQLPPSALVAFVDGARDQWEQASGG